MPGHVGLRESYSRLLQAVSRLSMLWIGERHYAKARNSLPHPFLKGRSRAAVFEHGHYVRVAVFPKPAEYLVDLGQSLPQPNHRNRLPEEKGLSNLGHGCRFGVIFGHVSRILSARIGLYFAPPLAADASAGGEVAAETTVSGRLP